MDNYWQVKCSSTRESFMPSMAAASQLQPQEPRNQVSNAGLYFHPHVMQSAAHEIIQEAIVPKTSDLLSDSSVHADLGSSFLSLLSGPPSLVQCDLHQFTSAKPFVTSSKVPVSSSCTVGAAGSGVSLACDQTYSQNMSIQNPKIGADLCPVVSPRCGKSFSLLDVLQASILNHHSVEPAKAVICHSDSGNEQVRDFSSLIRSYANAGKLQITSIQASQKAPLEINSSISRCSSTHQSGCPRVFCLGTSGDLLLSNTGLLGIVCLCHGVHMSISMFSEHSGLCDVNPGDAVHMDSGETIAQWRKLYFHKFGIRVPEDHIGWDWPQGISTTASVVKHSVTASNISKNSDLSSLVGSRGGFVGFGQHQNNVAFLGNHITGQKLVNEISCNGQQRNAQGSFNFLHKGLIGASQSNFPGVVDNQLMGCHLSGCVAMSKPFGVKGPENGCHSTFAFGDSHSKTGQSFISYQDLQNLKSSGNDSDINRLYNLKKGNPVEIDAVSSGTELRLGQPSPQSKTLGSSTLPAFNSHLFEAHGRGDPQKFLFSEQLIHNCARHGNSRAMEDHSLNLQYAAGSSNFCAKRGTSQLNLVKHATGINDARDVSIIQQSRDDAERSLAISKLLSQLKPPSDGRMHSIATAGVIDGCHVMPSKSHCESHITKSETTSSAWCRGYATETHLSTNILGQQKHVDKGKEVAFAADSERVATEPNCEFHRKHMESSTNCNGVSGIGCHSCLMEHDNSSPLHQFSGMPPYAFDPGNPFNHSGNIPFLGLNGHLDHGFLKLMRLPKDSGSLLPLQSVSMGFSAPTSTCSISSASPSLTTNEGSGVSTYFLDENLRALAFRHAIELSNEGRADASLGTIQDQGRLNNWCGGRSQGSTADPSSSKEHRHGLTVTNEQVASEVVMKALQSGFTCWMNGGAENIAPAAELP